MKGTIKRLTDKGFGFIQTSAYENDLFFHATALIDVTYADLHEGREVYFGVTETEKGTNATPVSLRFMEGLDKVKDTRAIEVDKTVGKNGIDNIFHQYDFSRICIRIRILNVSISHKR